MEHPILNLLKIKNDDIEDLGRKFAERTLYETVEQYAFCLGINADQIDDQTKALILTVSKHAFHAGFVIAQTICKDESTESRL